MTRIVENERHQQLRLWNTCRLMSVFQTLWTVKRRYVVVLNNCVVKGTANVETNRSLVRNDRQCKAGPCLRTTCIAGSVDLPIDGHAKATYMRM